MHQIKKKKKRKIKENIIVGKKIPAGTGVVEGYKGITIHEE